MMFEKKEALYLVDRESYLHLKETVTQTGFAYETFDKATGAAQHTGLITYEEMLENPIRNPLACARVMALQEIGLKGEVVSEVALRTLEQIKEARRAYRKEHPEDAHDHSIRFITSDYNELFRIPGGGKVQIDYAGRHFVSPCVYIDDYHTRIAGRVYHICEFAEMMERGGGTVAPEPEITANQAAWQIGHREYLSIQSTETGWDYSVYDRQFSGSGLSSNRRKRSLRRPQPSLICRRKRPKPKRKSRQNMLGTNRKCRRKHGNICASSLLFTTIQSTGGAPCSRETNGFTLSCRRMNWTACSRKCRRSGYRTRAPISAKWHWTATV